MSAYSQHSSVMCQSVSTAYELNGHKKSEQKPVLVNNHLMAAKRTDNYFKSRRSCKNIFLKNLFSSESFDINHIICCYYYSQ